MDVFNRLLTQINDLFKSLSPGARITTGLLLVAVVVGIGYLFNAQNAGAEAYLLNGQSFTADEMSAMEAAFGKAGLSDYTVDGSRVRISKSRQAAFLGALADAGAMPAHFGDFLGQATSSTGPFTDRVQREEMIKVAKQKELALVIRSMNGIESAAVHYDSQKSRGLNSTPIATASVSVKTRGLLPLPESQVAMIRSLVAASIAGLSPDKVTIADLNGGRTYTSSGANGGGSAFDDAYLSRVREYQGMYESSIRDRLSHIPGVLVTAGVELDREMVKHIEETKVDPKTVPLQSKVEENTTTSTSNGPGGRPGVASNVANQAASLSSAGGGGSQSEDTRTKTENTYASSGGRTTTQLAGLTPKRVTVSIGVPNTYFEKIWLQQNPPAAGAEPKKPDAAELTAVQDEELKRIREAILPLIPKPTDATTPIDANQLLNVTTFSAVPMPEPVGPTPVEQALDWLRQSWSSVAMVGLALVALVMLRSFVAAVPAAPDMPSILSTTVDEDDEAAAAATADGGDGKEGTKPKQRTLQRKVGNGANLREELVDMVREDPDAAANILRGWIGNAS